MQSFQEKEQALYADLSTLIKDASWLRHYMASALRVQGEALLGAASALGETARPDTSLSMSSLSLGSQGAGSQGGAAGAGSGMGMGGGDSRADMQRSAASDGPSNPFLTSGVIQH